MNMHLLPTVTVCALLSNYKEMFMRIPIERYHLKNIASIPKTYSLVQNSSDAVSCRFFGSLEGFCVGCYCTDVVRGGKGGSPIFTQKSQSPGFQIEQQTSRKVDASSRDI